MDFSLRASELAFRARLRVWLDQSLDPEWRDNCDTEEKYIQYQREWDHKLHAGGWAGIWWPKEFGGADASPSERCIYEEEMAQRDAPEGLGRVGRRLLGPGIIRFGTDEQKLGLLPRILSASDVWCQGYSEPDAGSDLASVKMTAQRDGDRYLLNGSKVWTSHAQYANKCFLLARTDAAAEKHAGLTFILVDMRQPEITVRPLEQITGHSEFAQIFFTDATAPVDSTLGREGQGWEVARYVLTYERGAAMVFARLIRLEGHLRKYATLAREDATEFVDLGRLSAQVAAARLLAYRVLSDQIAGGEPGPSGSLAKLYWSELWQRLAEHSLVYAGEEALAEPRRTADSTDFGGLYLDSRWVTIGAGTSEIQRNIIATRILGLPREDRA